MMPDHFREQQQSDPAPQLFLLIGAFVMGALAATLHAGAVFTGLWAVLAVLFVLAATLIRKLSIQVNPEEMRFGFGPFINRVQLSDIVSVRVLDSSTAVSHQPLTVGVHRTADNMSAWIARTGPLVEIRISRREESYRPSGYLVSTGRPTALIAALQPGQNSRIAEAP